MPGNQDLKASLFPVIPQDIRAARIGACYNIITGRIIEDRYAIDPSKTEPGKVIFVSGDGELFCTANSSSRSAANSSLFRLETEARAGYEGVIGGISVSLDYNMELASAAASQDDSLNCFCSYVFTGQRQTLVKMDPEELYKCMSSEFVKAHDAVINAADPMEYLKNYLSFIDAFGHGCVTTVFLTAGSAFRLTVAYSEASSAIRQKFGGSAALSGHYGGGYGGVSAASDWAKELSTADAKATINVTFRNMPENAPTADWCNQMMTNFLMIGINDLTTKATKIEAPKAMGEIPRPALPSGTPAGRTMPKPAIDTKSADVDSKMREALMAQDRFTGTWEEYLEKQKELYKTIKPRSVVEDARNIKKIAKGEGG